jgi:hypothetical protein
MEYLKIYCGVGLFFSTWLALYYQLNRNTIARPDSWKGIIEKMLGMIILWPIIVRLSIRKNIANLAIKPFSYKFDMNPECEPEARQKAVQAFWDKVPPCGQFVFFKGIDELDVSSESGTFIFDSGELVEHLDDNPMADLGLVTKNNHFINWLSDRHLDLPFSSKIPASSDHNYFNVFKAVKQGVGEGYCAKCKHIYSAKELIVPKPRLQDSFQIDTISCPKAHILHQVSAYLFICYG